MDSNHRTGALYELKAAAYFIEQGYDVYFPHATQSRADFVIDTPDGLRKIQVKKATWSTTGPYKYLQCRLISRNKYRKAYAAEDFDLIVFCDGDDLWITDFETVSGMTSVCLASTNPDYRPKKDYNPEDWRV